MLWRLGFFWQGFLEGDQEWGRVRQYVVFLLMFALALLAGIVKTALYPDQLGWLERIPLLADSPLPDILLRFTSNVFSWQALRFMILPLIPLSVAILVGAHYIQDIYEMNTYLLAVRYLLSCLFAWNYQRLTIRDGRPVERPGQANLLRVIGGPGYIFVTPGSAVLCESLTSPSSVLGQGGYFITRFETIKEVIDLTDQHGYIERTSAMTKDGLVVTIRDIHFRYRVWGGRRQGGVTGRSPEFPFPFSPRSIRNIVYNRQIRGDSVSPWSLTVQNGFDGEILSYIRQHQLNEIITEGDGVSRAREEIRRSLMSSGMRDRMRNMYGCELLWFDIGHFSYEEPLVEEEWINTWAADWIGRSEVERAQGDAERQAVIERARAEAQADILRAMTRALNENNLSGEMSEERLVRLFLLKASEALEGIKGDYTPNPNGA